MVNSKRSIWSALLAVVLAMIVMAGLAVTSFAVTDGGAGNDSIPVVDSVDELTAVLDGTKTPDANVNYDVDGNGIVEWDDLACLNGTLADAGDLLDLLTSESKNSLQSLIVKGDSTRALALNGGQSVTLTFAESVDISENQKLLVDTLWPDGAGSFQVVFLSGDKETAPVTVTAAQAGWSTVEAPLAALDNAVTANVTGVRIALGEGGTTYFDNFRTEGELNRITVSFDSTDETVEAITGQLYGELPAPVRAFFTFGGWYLNDVKVTADTIVTAETDHTLVAKWSPIESENDTVQVSFVGDNTYDLTLPSANYRQIRFKFRLKSNVNGNFLMKYVDSDSIQYNNPLLTIVDEENNTVRASQVEEGKWYTAFIFGTNELNERDIWTDATIASSGTLTFTENVQMEVVDLEALTAQMGYRMYSKVIGWEKVELPESVGGGYGYDMYQNVPDSDGDGVWNSRTEIAFEEGKYDRLVYDFYIYEAGAESPDFWSSGAQWMPVFTDDEGNVVTQGGQLEPGKWYTATVDMSSWTAGTKYNYVTNFAKSHFKAYIANIYYVCDSEMTDNIAPSTAVSVTNVGADGTFITERITRDDDRAIYHVTGSSTNWDKRVIGINLLNTEKEIIQLDFRFLISQNTQGADVAPTLLVSTSLSEMNNAQYIILDENDAPVTQLENGKWYRLFITANSERTFGLIPATVGEVEIQFKNLEAYNIDELPVTMTSDSTGKGNMSAVLTRFGKLQYIYTGMRDNTVTVTLDSSDYKQLRFSVKSDASISVTGAQAEVTGSGTWKDVVITNNGNNLPSTLTINVGKGVLLIKDLAGYMTADAPVQNTSSAIFHGLDSDEMMLAGFIGPADEYYSNYDNLEGYMPSLLHDEIFQKLANVGINYIVDMHADYADAGEESAKQILRLAAKYGINYMLSSSDIAKVGEVVGTQTTGSYTQNIYRNHIADWSVFSAKLDEMAQYESFGGLFLRDEPSSDLFETIRNARERVVDWYDGRTLNVFVNLLPGVGSFSYNNGNQAPSGYTIFRWQDYVKCFEDMTNFDYLMFDMYPFSGAEGVIEGEFIEYASRLATIAKKEGKMWMGCVQVGGGDVAYSGKRVCNENEMNWNVNVMLAMGVNGLNYYTLVSAPYLGGTVDPTEPGYTDHSLLTTRGEKTDYYDWAAKINKQVKAVDHVIMNAEQIGLIFVGDQLTYTGGTGNGNTAYKYESIADSDHIPLITQDGTYGKKYADVKLTSISGKHVMIGAFNYNGQTALLVVNNSISESDNITLNFDSAYSYQVVEDALTSWQIGTTVNLDLEAGYSALVLVHEGKVTMDATIKFNLNYDASAPAPADIVVALDGAPKYPALPTVSRDDCVFAGWYTDAACTGNPVKMGDTITANGDVVLYAKWHAIPEVLAAADYLQLASEIEKTAVGIPAGQKMYVYTKPYNVAADPGQLEHPAAICFSNEDGYDYISFDFYCKAFNSNSADYGYYMCLSNGQGGYIGLGSNLQVTDAATGSPLTVKDNEGTWFEFTPASGGWQTITCKVTDLPGLYIALFKSTEATLYITNVQGSNSLQSNVSFDLNYDGAENSLDTKKVTKGEAYGELPTPTREDYLFCGWYLNNECLGGKITAENLVNSVADHTLYAKWSDGPSVLAAADYLQLASEIEKTAVGIPAGQKMYVYTKPYNVAADPGQLEHPAAICFSNEDGYDYISFDFYCKAFNSNSADYGYYMCLSNGQGGYIGLGSNLQVTDAATGYSLGATDKEGTWFTFTPASGGWQTITCKVTDLSELYIALFKSTEATLYITNVRGGLGELPSVTEDPGLVSEPAGNLHVTTSEELTAAGITDVTGVVYRFNRVVNANDTLYLRNKNDKAYVTFNVRYSAFSNDSEPNLNGKPYLLVTPNGGGTWMTAGSDGVIVVQKSTGTAVEVFSKAYNLVDLDAWYTVVIPTKSVSQLTLAFNAADSATMYISNIAWSDELPEIEVPDEPDVPEETEDPGLVARNPSYLSEATAEELTAAGITDATGTVYRFTKGEGSADPNGGEYVLWLENQYRKDYVTFDVRYSAFLGKDPYLLIMPATGLYWTSKNSDITFVEKGTGSAVNSDDAYNYMDQNKWYTVTVPMYALSEIYFSWDTNDTATVFITDIIWSDEIPEPEETENPGLVARNSAYLSVATSDELAAAGITDATGTVYRFTKGNESADPNGGPYALWLENRNNNTYVTFDIRYSAFQGKNPYLLIMPASGSYWTPGNSGITFLQKGTDISATESDGAYNWIDLNTWYTVTVPVSQLSELYLSWDGSDTATVFITNIVWSDAA